MRQIIFSLFLIFSAGALHAEPFEDHKGIPGDYSVPVPAELEQFASYPVEKVCWFNSNDDVIIGYALPSELTGRSDSQIILTGKAPKEGAFTLSGAGGSDQARCVRDTATKTVECKVSYAELNFDPATRAKLLAEEFTDKTELAGRMLVAMHFQRGPEGIIKFADQPEAIPTEDPRWGKP